MARPVLEELLRPKPRTRVRAEWFSLYPTRRNDLRFWALVALRIKQQRVRSTDRRSITRICQQVDATFPLNQARIP